MNKIIITIGLLLGFVFANAQVGIETEIVRGDGLMDFPENATKGIILPKNTNTSNSGTEGGSLAFNVATQKVEYYDNNPSSAGWVAMTSAATGVASDLSTSATDVGRATTETGEGTLVTNESDTTAPVGVLELRSSNKALILPTVATSSDLPVGEVGMICYVKDVKTMAVFNGTEWSFWN